MAKKLYEESNISAIAAAIRSKNGSQDTYTTAEMADAIEDIETGGILVTKSISENGTYNALLDDDADGYSQVTVNVQSGGGGSSKEFLYEINEAQGSIWINTEVSISNINTLLFEDIVDGDVLKEIIVDVSDIVVYTGSVDVYTNIYSEHCPMNARIYNDFLYVSYNGTGTANYVTKIYKYSESGGGGDSDAIGLASLSSVFSGYGDPFGQEPNSWWGCSSENPGWILISFSQNVKVSTISFANTFHVGSYDWSAGKVSIEYSDDGVSWVYLTELDSLTYDVNNYYTISIADSGYHSKYRINVFPNTNHNPAYWPGLGKVQLTFSSSGGGSSLPDLDNIDFGNDPVLPSGKGQTDPQFYENIAEAINYAIEHGGDKPVPGLPASTQSNILASAYADNFVDLDSPWGGFIFDQSKKQYIAKNKYCVNFTNGAFASFDLGEENYSHVAYIVCSNSDWSTTFPRLYSCRYSKSNQNEPCISSYSNRIDFSTYGNTLNAGLNGVSLAAYALCINNETKKMKCYTNGIYIGELAFLNSGQFISISAAIDGSEYSASSFYYVGVVDGVESDSVIIENLEYLMSVFGIDSEED